jgi:hypothetical protein
MKNPKYVSKTILVGLASLAFLQMAQAVVPAPDGGYPGGNTAEGTSALLGLTTGTYNTAIGLFSLRAVTDGQLNTGVGAGTLFNNTANANTATGAGALLSNSIGHDNTANGTFALFSSTNGNGNTAEGSQALFQNTSGVNNTAIGQQALANNTVAVGNTAVGAFALVNSADGDLNTALGINAGFNITNASHVICIGANIVGENVDNTTYIGNINTTAQAPLPGKVDLVTVDLATGKLGHTPAVGAGVFQAQADTVGELKKQIAALRATVKEQATQIQKVSAQIELSRPEPKFVKGR